MPLYRVHRVALSHSVLLIQNYRHSLSVAAFLFPDRPSAGHIPQVKPLSHPPVLPDLLSLHPKAFMAQPMLCPVSMFFHLCKQRHSCLLGLSMPCVRHPLILDTGRFRTNLPCHPRKGITMLVRLQDSRQLHRMEILPIPHLKATQPRDLNLDTLLPPRCLTTTHPFPP